MPFEEVDTRKGRPRVSSSHHDPFSEVLLQAHVGSLPPYDPETIIPCPLKIS